VAGWLDGWMALWWVGGLGCLDGWLPGLAGWVLVILRSALTKGGVILLGGQKTDIRQKTIIFTVPPGFWRNS